MFLEVLSADLGSDLLAVLGRLGGVGALRPLHSLALGGHHVSTDGVKDLLLHHHGNGKTHSPGDILTLRDGDILAYRLGDINTALLQHQLGD